MNARHPIRGKRLPPYGRELRIARERGIHPNVFVMAGAYAWRRAKSRSVPEVLVAPPGEPPESFDWSSCRGLDVLLVCWGMSPIEVRELGEAIIKAGAIGATVVTPDGRGPRFVPAPRGDR